MTLVDGLRAFAAMGVVCVHAGGLLHVAADTPGAALIPLIDPYRDLGGVGVDIFFVLSGFVIAHSVGRSRVGASYFGRFVLRRSIRLDVPYVASIALAVGLLAFRGRFGNEEVDWPTAGQLAAHLLYLQKFLGYDHLMVIYWTLCLEVQFYIAFVLLLWGNARRRRTARGRWPMLVAVGGVAVAFVASLAWPIGAFEIPHHLENVWFPAALAQVPGRCGRRICGRGPVASGRCTGGGDRVGGGRRDSEPNWGAHHEHFARRPDRRSGKPPGCCCWRLIGGALYRWLDWRPLLFVGGVSYSVYLIHIPVIAVLLGVQKRQGATTQPAAIGFFLAALVLSVASAWVMFNVCGAARVAAGIASADQAGRRCARWSRGRRFGRRH